MDVQAAQDYFPLKRGDPPMDNEDIEIPREESKYRKFRVFHLRMNNVTSEELEKWKDLIKEHCREGIISNVEYGRERGIPHVHCHLQTVNQFTVQAITKLFIPETPKRKENLDYHISPGKFYFNNKFTVENNREYVMKRGIQWQYNKDASHNRTSLRNEVPLSTEEEAEYLSFLNNLPEKPTVNTLESIMRIPRHIRHEYIRKSFNMPEKTGIISLYEKCHKVMGHNYGHAFFNETYHSTQAMSVRKLYPCIRDVSFPTSEEIEILWIYGGAGTGKTSFANLLYPGAYLKNKDTVYWESYDFTDHSLENPHMCVIFNELDTVQDLLSFSPNQKSFDTIKNIMDINPFPIEIKHRSQEMIRPRRIIITSNTTLDHIMNTLTYTARHDTPNNPFFMIDVGTLSQALKRRVIEVHIKELLDTYGLFCWPKMKTLHFGGVFPQKYKAEIKNELADCVQHVYRQGREELNHEVKLLRQKWEKKTIDYLECFRYVKYTEVKEMISPPSLTDVLDELAKLSN